VLAYHRPTGLVLSNVLSHPARNRERARMCLLRVITGVRLGLEVTYFQVLREYLSSVYLVLRVRRKIEECRFLC
jgi:hypothetical protein